MWGLFARETLKRNDLVGFYTGELLTGKQNQSRSNNFYYLFDASPMNY